MQLDSGMVWNEQLQKLTHINYTPIDPLRTYTVILNEQTLFDLDTTVPLLQYLATHPESIEDQPRVEGLYWLRVFYLQNHKPNIINVDSAVDVNSDDIVSYDVVESYSVDMESVDGIPSLIDDMEGDMDTPDESKMNAILDPGEHISSIMNRMNNIDQYESTDMDVSDKRIELLQYFVDK